MSFSELALYCEKSLNFDSWLLIKSKYNISSLKKIYCVLFYIVYNSNEDFSKNFM